MKIEVLKKYTETVDAFHKVGSALALLVPSALAWPFVGSATLFAFITIAALVGGGLGFYFTLTAFTSKGRSTCLAARTRYLFFSLLGVVVAIVVLIVTNPNLAALSSTVAVVREVLLEVALILNLLVAGGVFVFVYFLVGAIVLSSSRMWEASLDSR